jgi:GNAT superfamily N-acetyltransferase
MPPLSPDFSSLSVGFEDPNGEAAQKLIHDLCAELSERCGAPSPFSPSEATAPRAAFVVARINTQPVGCGAIRRIDEATAEVKRMYVTPAGRGQGISRRILATLERAASDFGYHSIRLETGIYQTRAIGLYESSGYRRIPAFGHYVGNPISVCYEKLLDDSSGQASTAA